MLGSLPKKFRILPISYFSTCSMTKATDMNRHDARNSTRCYSYSCSRCRPSEGIKWYDLGVWKRSNLYITNIQYCNIDRNNIDLIIEKRNQERNLAKNGLGRSE